MQGRRVEAISPPETGDGLVDDVVAVIASMAARISGETYWRSNSRRRAEQIKACVEHVMHAPEAVEEA